MRRWQVMIGLFLVIQLGFGFWVRAVAQRVSVGECSNDEDPAFRCINQVVDFGSSVIPVIKSVLIWILVDVVFLLVWLVTGRRQRRQTQQLDIPLG